MNSFDVKRDSVWLMYGDCLERMKEIPDGSVDLILTDQEIVTYYESGMSMREVATLAKTNHKRVSRILKRKGVAKRTPVGKPKKTSFQVRPICFTTIWQNI